MMNVGDDSSTDWLGFNAVSTIQYTGNNHITLNRTAQTRTIMRDALPRFIDPLPSEANDGYTLRSKPSAATWSPRKSLTPDRYRSQ